MVDIQNSAQRKVLQKFILQKNFDKILISGITLADKSEFGQNFTEIFIRPSVNKSGLFQYLYTLIYTLFEIFRREKFQCLNNHAKYL